jgi:hypothetical protein
MEVTSSMKYSQILSSEIELLLLLKWGVIEH